MAAFANSLGNGFALDDNWFIIENDVVTEGRFGQALTQASWPGALEGTGNYRPLALSSFALEWAVWGDDPFGYHGVSVAVNAVVAVLAFLVLRTLFAPIPAAIGAGFFAIHPVHVEAVANVMGRSELYAALGYFAALLVYLRWRPTTTAARGARLLSILALFAVALAGKEIAVTLPAMLIAFELYRPSDMARWQRIRRETPTYAATFGLLGCYVLVRWGILGDLTGESAAAGLRSLDSGERILTALTVWPHYLRLLFAPLDLSADYSPAVLIPSTTVNGAVLGGAAILCGVGAGAIAGLRRNPTLGLAAAWFLIAISPVSNLIVRSDILLAERTLFLPSFGAAIAIAWVASRALTDGAAPRSSTRLVLGGIAIAGVLLMSRTVTRNPTWMDTFTVLSTLNDEHPESWMSWRVRATGLSRVGETQAAQDAWETALTIAPDHYQLLVDAAEFYDGIGRHDRSEALLDQAINLLPAHPAAYRRVAEYRIRRGDGRGAHAAAAAGIRHARNDRLVWGLLSETYVMKADLEAAVRARTASIAVQETPAGWTRLAELLDALGRSDDATRARAEAQRTERS